MSAIEYLTLLTAYFLLFVFVMIGLKGDNDDKDNDDKKGGDK